MLYITYATASAGDREIPAAQWTRTEQPSDIAPSETVDLFNANIMDSLFTEQIVQHNVSVENMYSHATNQSIFNRCSSRIDDAMRLRCKCKLM